MAIEDWRPGEPLPIPFYSPLVTGLSGVRKYIERDDWLDAITEATATYGLQGVMERMRRASVIVQGLDIDKIPVETEDELQEAYAWINELGVRGFWAKYLDNVTLAYGLTDDTGLARRHAENHIKQNIIMIVAIARFGFKAWGRGAFVVDLTRQVANTSGEVGYASIYASDMAVRREHIGWPNEYTRLQVRHYDPDRVVIVVAICDVDSKLAYFTVNVEPEIPPETCLSMRLDQIMKRYASGKPDKVEALPWREGTDGTNHHFE